MEKLGLSRMQRVSCHTFSMRVPTTGGWRMDVPELGNHRNAGIVPGSWVLKDLAGEGSAHGSQAFKLQTSPLLLHSYFPFHLVIQVTFCTYPSFPYTFPWLSSVYSPSAKHRNHPAQNQLIFRADIN